MHLSKQMPSYHYLDPDNIIQYKLSEIMRRHDMVALSRHKDQAMWNF